MFLNYEQNIQCAHFRIKYFRILLYITLKPSWRLEFFQKIQYERMQMRVVTCVRVCVRLCMFVCVCVRMCIWFPVRACACVRTTVQCMMMTERRERKYPSLLVTFTSISNKYRSISARLSSHQKLSVKYLRKFLYLSKFLSEN